MEILVLKFLGFILIDSSSLPKFSIFSRPLNLLIAVLKPPCGHYHARSSCSGLFLLFFILFFI